MKPSVNILLSHRKSYFSQSGEDGLLEYVLSKIPKKSKTCVEFGAWDGVHLSNTYYFISRQGYRGVLIEAEGGKYALLRENMKPYDCICLNAFVARDGENKLDSILKQTPIPFDFDLLSIDVDGEDYQIWDSLQEYSPKVVMVEINIRDKPGVEHINQPGAPFVWELAGTSISSMTNLANSKGYSLVANVGCNAIYVRREYLGLFHEREVRPDEVFTFEGHSIRELSLLEMRNLGAAELMKKMVRLMRGVLRFGYEKVAFFRKMTIRRRVVTL